MTVPRASSRLKELWADPVWRAATIAKQQAGLAKLTKKEKSRTGVPDGMRKRDAETAWEKARAEGKRFIKIMEDAGKVAVSPVPGSEEEMAKKALEEAYANAVSPMTDMKNKATYIRIVLEWTKAKPESKSKLTLEKSEEWLDALAEDMKRDSGDA